MNFLDSYEVSETPTTPSNPGPEPTLNEEVSQVVGQLGRLWGGFRKQSQSVFESARKEVGQVVSQAQKELTKLSEPQSDEGATTSSSSDQAPAGTEDAEAEAGPSSSTSSTTSTDREAPTTPTPKHARGPSVSVAAQNIFSRLQSALPSDLASTVQSKLPDSIKQGAGSVDFAQLRSTLASEFQRVQGITKAQAEEYVHKSEELFRDAGEFLKEAVKVVPPEEGGQITPGIMWDGSDIWMLPEMSAPVESKGKGKQKQSSAEGLRAVATRAEALLKQLKHDPEVIKADPEADERAAQLWNEWLSVEVDTNEEGISSKRWEDAKDTALSDPVDGEALKKTHDVLVPSIMPTEMFWKRYFFRVHQVSSEEERRKALLQGTVDNEEEFGWESDEEDATSPTTKSKAQPHAVDERPRSASVKDSTEPTPVAKVSATSTPVSNNGEAKEEDLSASKVTAKPSKEGDEDDEDSDWE